MTRNYESYNGFETYQDFSEERTGTKAPRSNRKKFCIIASIVVVIAVVAGLIAFFLFVRKPTVDVIEVVMDPSKTMSINTTGITLPWILKLKVNNPNFFAMTFDKIKASGASKDVDSLLGEGEIADITLPKQSTADVDFPWSMVITPPYNEGAYKTMGLLQAACFGPKPARKKINIAYTLSFGYKVIGSKGLVPKMTNELSIDCPFDLDLKHFMTNVNPSNKQTTMEKALSKKTPTFASSKVPQVSTNRKALVNPAARPSSFPVARANSPLAGTASMSNIPSTGVASMSNMPKTVDRASMLNVPSVANGESMANRASAPNIANVPRSPVFQTAQATAMRPSAAESVQSANNAGAAEAARLAAVRNASILRQRLLMQQAAASQERLGRSTQLRSAQTSPRQENEVSEPSNRDLPTLSLNEQQRIRQNQQKTMGVFADPMAGW